LGGAAFLFVEQVRLSLLFVLKGSTIIDAAFWCSIALIVMSLFTKRFFCRYLCPTGAKYGIYSLIRPITIRKDDSCINCNKCNEICPMGINVPKTKSLASPNCINCYKCIEVCPVNALKIGFRNYKTF